MPAEDDISEFKKVRQELLSVGEAASELGVSRYTVYRLIRSGRLKSVQWGIHDRDQTWVPKHELEKFAHAARKQVRV